MKTPEELKTIVKEKYSEIAEQHSINKSTTCCGVVSCSDELYNLMPEDYANLKGYNSDADLGLGCGLPVQFAVIKIGDTVIDLGSGAGNDCFIARAETGAEGKVIGIDMTPAMISKAMINAGKLGYNNIEFRLGEIEDIPVANNIADVVISNCVLNLVPGKRKAFSEIFRVIKDGGHFSISDVVIRGVLPEGILETAEMYAGCISGAINIEDYLLMIKEAGFENIIIQKEKIISLPDDILKKYIDENELIRFKESGAGIYSITVYAEKPIEGCCNKSTCCN